jgi:hypothetical protein
MTMHWLDAQIGSTPGSPAWQIRLMTMSYFIPRCLHVVAQLDIATRLSDQTKTASELADEVGVHGPTLHRVLRALASTGVFKEIDGSRFENTALSQTLRSDAQDSMRPWVLLYGDETALRSWGEFAHSVKTGSPAFEYLYGMTLFEYNARQPGRAAVFDAAMSTVTSLASQAIIAAYRFSDIGLLVDVGGGKGTMLCAVLKANPNVKGVLFDLPYLADRATNYIASQRLQSRCAFVAGSFFDSVHAKADAYFLQRVLHDWDDEHSVKILQACSNAARPGARILVSEAVIPSGNDPFLGKLSDLHMLVMTHGGRERTLDEYRNLLDRSGWTYARIVSTTTPFSIVEGTKQ